MSRQVTVERKEAGAEDQKLYGFRVKDTCPRDTLDVPVKYRVFQFDEFGNPIKATFKKPVAVEGLTVINEYKDTQPWADFGHVYTFQKRYRDPKTGTPVPGARFERVPVSVAQAIARHYGHVLEVKEISPGVAEDKRYEAFMRADLIEVPADLPTIAKTPRPANPLALSDPNFAKGQDKRRENEPADIVPQVGERDANGRVKITENEAPEEMESLEELEKAASDASPGDEVSSDDTVIEDEHEPDDPNLPEEDEGEPDED